MKSPYRIAKEIGVSPQAVYKKLDNGFIEKLNNHIQKNKKGNYLLDSFAEEALKATFNLVVQPNIEPETATEPNELINRLNSEIEFLKEILSKTEEELIKEREHNREQSDKVINLANQLTELTKNNQILLGAEQSKNNPQLFLEENNKKSKKGIFRLFRKSEK